MYKLQILALLLAGLTFCAVAQRGTFSPNEEAETLDVTKETYTQSTESQTQAHISEVNITELFENFTEELTVETHTLDPGNENSTNDSVIIEDPEGLELGTLIGIITGIVLTIGICAIIIILIVRKMGRYSP
ncbi:uncharacterized protein O3C94_015010 [Discoglossus pictus]